MSQLVTTNRCIYSSNVENRCRNFVERDELFCSIHSDESDSLDYNMVNDDSYKIITNKGKIIIIDYLDDNLETTNQYDILMNSTDIDPIDLDDESVHKYGTCCLCDGPCNPESQTCNGCS